MPRVRAVSSGPTAIIGAIGEHDVATTISSEQTFYLKWSDDEGWTGSTDEGAGYSTLDNWNLEGGDGAYELTFKTDSSDARCVTIGYYDNRVYALSVSNGADATVTLRDIGSEITLQVFEILSDDPRLSLTKAKPPPGRQTSTNIGFQWDGTTWSYWSGTDRDPPESLSTLDGSDCSVTFYVSEEGASLSIHNAADADLQFAATKVGDSSNALVAASTISPTPSSGGWVLMNTNLQDGGYSGGDDEVDYVLKVYTTNSLRPSDSRAGPNTIALS